MTSKRLSRLLALSDSESGRKQPKPARQRFKPLNVNLMRFGGDWERQRGAVARMMGVVLREGSESLFAKVSASDQTVATFGDAVGWLETEAVYLRKLAARMDIAATRLGSVVARCRAATSQGSGAADDAPSLPADLPRYDDRELDTLHDLARERSVSDDQLKFSTDIGDRDVPLL